MRCGRRERCTRRTTLYGARRHLSRGTPGPPWVEAVAVGYVAASVPLLGAPSLADSSAEVADGSTLSFFLERALEVKRKEEEAVEVAELTELEEKVAAAEVRLLGELQKDRTEAIRVTAQPWPTLSQVEQLANSVVPGQGYGGEEEGNDEVDALAPGWVPVLLLFMTSLTILSSVSWVVSTAPCIWQSLVLFGSCLRSTGTPLFWEMTSGYVVFRFDSGFLLLPVYRFWGSIVFVYSARNAWFSVVHAMRQSRSLRRRFPCRGAEAVSCGPDCLSDQRDSPVVGQSDRCPCCAGRAASRSRRAEKLWFFTVADLGHVGDMPVVAHDRSWRYRRCFLAVLDVAVITQRQVGVSSTVEVPQIQFIAPFEDTPVAQQRRVRTVQLCMEFSEPWMAKSFFAIEGSCTIHP